MLIDGQVEKVTISGVLRDIFLRLHFDAFDSSQVYRKRREGVGPFALLEPNTETGHHSIIGSYATVRGKFPPYSFIVGNPNENKPRVPKTEEESMMEY